MYNTTGEKCCITEIVSLQQKLDDFKGIIILQTYIPRRGKEIAFGSDSSNNSNFLVWSIVKYLKIYPKFNRCLLQEYNVNLKKLVNTLEQS